MQAHKSNICAVKMCCTVHADTCLDRVNIWQNKFIILPVVLMTIFYLSYSSSRLWLFFRTHEVKRQQEKYRQKRVICKRRAGVCTVEKHCVCRVPSVVREERKKERKVGKEEEPIGGRRHKVGGAKKM